MPISFCVLLWAHEGREEALSAYEDEVLTLLADHGGAVVSRVRSLEGGRPTEVQVIAFADEAGYEAYLADPRRTALAARRDAAVARTELFRVSPR